MVDGTTQCWGYNNFGQIGNATTVNQTTPVVVPGLTAASAVFGGYEYTCTVQRDTTLECWGYNNTGQLGNGTAVNSSAPVAVSQVTGAVSVALGRDHTCALIQGGTVLCWGSNISGQLGNGSTATYSNTAVSVNGISTAIAVTSGWSHSCALLRDHTIQCWGYNGDGQLGTGDTTASPTPARVSSISTAVAVGGGDSHTCALTQGGAVLCWGRGNSGQLGSSVGDEQYSGFRRWDRRPLGATSVAPAKMRYSSRRHRPSH